MTPKELANAMLRVIPGRKPEHCQNWSVAARLAPETKSVLYTVSLNVSTSFNVPDALMEFPAELGDAFELEAEDICEVDRKISALLAELDGDAEKDEDYVGQRNEPPRVEH